MKISKFIPALDWIKSYNGKLLAADSIAGLTVWIMLVPQGMAYAMLAGMPPIYGLYGGLIPLFLYGLLGTSRQLSIGPVAVSALLVLAGISQIATPGTPEYITLVLLTGLMIGVVQLSMGLLRLGFLINFLSHPVIIGFTSAAAIIIAVSQLKYLLGIDIPRFEHVYETAIYAFEHISEIHWPSFAICTTGILLIFLSRSISRSIPIALIITVLGILIVYFFDLQQYGVKIVGQVPQGLPEFAIPELSFDNLQLILPTVFTVAIIGIVESIGIAKVLEAKNKDCEIRPNQELLALGISKVAGAFFQAIPTSGSFTRSAVNDDAGGKTGLSSMITAILIGLTLIFLTPLFYYLPEAVLAAIILVAVKGLFNVKEAKQLWQTDRRDFVLMMATFVFTLTLGIEIGVLIGVLLSLALILYNISKGQAAVLGRVKDSHQFVDLADNEEASPIQDVMIFQFNGPLIFCNANAFKSDLIQLFNQQEKKPALFIFDASNIYDIDSSGIHVLEETYEWVDNQGSRFRIAGLITPVKDQLEKVGFLEHIGQDKEYLTIDHALSDFRETEQLKEAADPTFIKV